MIRSWLCLFLAGSAAWADASGPPPPTSPASLPPKDARVIVVHADQAVATFHLNPEKIRLLVDGGVRQWTGKSDVASAWRSLVSPRDVVGLKVDSAPGAISGTRPAVVEAVIQGLLAAGTSATNLIIWDRHLVDLRLAGFDELGRRYGVRVAGAASEGYDDKTFYDTPLIGRLVWGDHEFGQTAEHIGRKSFVSRLVARDMTKIISIAPLLNHNQLGTSGHLVGLALGSVDNLIRFEADPDRLSTAVPEIFALPVLGDRVALCITDSLLGQYQGEKLGHLHYSTVLNELWFSADPVALDVLAIQELDRERAVAGVPPMKAKLELYTNAADLQLGVSDTNRIRIVRGP